MEKLGTVILILYSLPLIAVISFNKSAIEHQSIYKQMSVKISLLVMGFCLHIIVNMLPLAALNLRDQIIIVQSQAKNGLTTQHRSSQSSGEKKKGKESAHPKPPQPNGPPQPYGPPQPSKPDFDFEQNKLYLHLLAFSNKRIQSHKKQSPKSRSSNPKAKQGNNSSKSSGSSLPLNSSLPQKKANQSSNANTTLKAHRKQEKNSPPSCCMHSARASNRPLSSRRKRKSSEEGEGSPQNKTSPGPGDFKTHLKYHLSFHQANPTPLPPVLSQLFIQPLDHSQKQSNQSERQRSNSNSSTPASTPHSTLASSSPSFFAPQDRENPLHTLQPSIYSKVLPGFFQGTGLHHAVSRYLDGFDQDQSDPHHH